MRSKYFDLLFIIALTIVNIVWSLLRIQVPFIGIILAFPLVFFVPGYTLAKIMLYNKSSDKTHFLILSIGLSIALSIVNGFVLNLFSFGLQATSWTVSLGLISSFFALISVYLGQRSSIQIHLTPLKSGISRYFLVGIAVTLVVFSFWYSTITIAQEPQQGFTQFWMLPAKQQSSQSCNISVGVRNFEATTTTYRIEMSINGTQAKSWTSVVLAPQQEWDQAIPVDTTASNTMYLEAQLYRADKPNSMYREVHMTLNKSLTSKDQKLQCTL